MVVMKKYILSFLALIILFSILFVLFILVTPDSLSQSILTSIGLSLMFISMKPYEYPDIFDGKNDLKILSFLSIISIIVIIIVNICNQKELFRTVFMCIAIPALAFSAYYTSKRFMRDKRKTGKNVE
jgi:hypothetical protein